MAVVPTSHHVTLTYGTTTADQLGKLASLGGVVGLGMLMTLRAPVMNRPPRAPAPSPEPVIGEESDVVAPVRSGDEDTGPGDPLPASEPYGPPAPSPEATDAEELVDWRPGRDGETHRE